MIDRSLVTSGFDTETLVSERFLRYILFTQIEAGVLPLERTFVSPELGLDVSITLHVPEDYEREYDPDPAAPLPDGTFAGSFAFKLLPESAGAFMSLAFVVTGKNNNTGQGLFGAIELLLDVHLESVVENGLESQHQLRLELVGLTDGTINLLEFAGIDPVVVENELRNQLAAGPGVIPLGIAQGQRVQQIRLRKFVDGDHRSLGLYVDLALRSGPDKDEFREPRGNVDNAQDFRPADAEVVFSTSQQLFQLLGKDLTFRQAEETPPCSGDFRFPLRKDPFDKKSAELGRIKGITVGPEIVQPPSFPPQTTGRLMIDMHGEYTDAPFDPDFHIQIFLDPKITDGRVDWDFDVDVDLGLLATLLGIAAGIGLTLLFFPVSGAAIFISAIASAAVIKGLLVEPILSKIVGDRLDDDAFASVLEALPFRVPTASRRWDPFYVTEHQVVLLVKTLAIDTLGVACEADDLILGKQPRAVNHVAIRDEERAPDGSITAFRYRVSDFDDIADDLEAVGPGRDRMDFSRTDPAGEPTLVSLTDAQIAERISAKRLFAPITYTAERIFVVDNQIDQLLCVSRRERVELAQGFIDEFRSAKKDEIQQADGDQILAEVTEQLEIELGRPPTQEEIDQAFDHRLDRLVDCEQPPFEEDVLPGLVNTAVAQILRFDLAPEELIQRQLAKVVVLDGKEVIVRHNDDGTITPYYRDRPDGDPRDNLLALPHYTPPYQPPA